MKQNWGIAAACGVLILNLWLTVQDIRCSGKRVTQSMPSHFSDTTADVPWEKFKIFLSLGLFTPNETQVRQQCSSSIIVSLFSTSGHVFSFSVSFLPQKKKNKLEISSILPYLCQMHGHVCGVNRHVSVPSKYQPSLHCFWWHPLYRKHCCFLTM